MQRPLLVITLFLATGCSVSAHHPTRSHVPGGELRAHAAPELEAISRQGAPGTVAARPFTVVEATIPQMQAAMAEGRTTSREIVAEYLARIALHDRRLNAAIAVNPQSLVEAEALDRERAAGRARGPLHGIPIAVKDNIQTIDLPTTAGMLALHGFVAPYEATIVRNLRAAGAIIIAKTGMNELAAWMAPTPGGYNAVTRYPLNPYDPRPDPRPRYADGRAAMPVGGSSSGVGTAANLWAASVGTETFISILNPSAQTMLVGLKPTVGRLSRYGIVPVTADQDTPGPMTRTVTDAAILLGVMEGATRDAHDPAAGVCESPPGNDYTRYLRRDALRGARIGVPRAFFLDTVPRPGFHSFIRGRVSREAIAHMAEAIAILRREGAIIVDPADLPSVASPDTAKSWLHWPLCVAGAETRAADSNCTITMKYAMKRDFNEWLRSLGPAAPFRSLTELREWNLANQERGTLRFGQERLDISDEMDLESDRPRYEQDRAKDLRLAREEGIDAVMQRYRLDALLFPAWTASMVASAAGYPAVTVPFGMVANSPSPPFPDGFDPLPMPFGVSFTASRCAEPRLIELAFAFEQATRSRVAPSETP